MHDQTRRSLFSAMLRIRRVEEALATRYAEQMMRCPMHLCIGQEAIAVGVCTALRKEDKVFSNHRAHGHYLAKGGDLNAMVAELYGRATGCCGGRGGSMHLIDLAVGFMGATPIVGGTVPLAVGSAWAASLQDTHDVSVSFLGDGCFEEGVVHESLNFAALHRLPIIFVCENNDFSVYTRRNERQPNRPIYRIAEAHGMPVAVADGNDVETVVSLVSAAVDSARSGNGPQFLEFDAYRWREHCGPDFDDHLKYRSVQEIQTGMNNCPIDRYKTILLQTGILDELGCAGIETQIREEVSAAFDFALASSKPTIKDAWEKVYA
ncbi:MAG: thiamine pyrophosphate-dependent dehydrogenase E1 component subunit alpha [Nitrospira sp.]|uniref:thiamine pyrophosphate-dependent dehydrogenase E1 component subunit alpha n=1 Tax=Nitrospira sp. BLG_1 TaxID=3395883 RepID=UPI001DF98D21|nr:thiamine pyrophosphate-dependent dehydrogenase E1 component subunit alpha [Nitrospira sp.]MBX3347940.1 thiamine pyrophosphate-dependent dehydrogenase E1 component subunit alpha [Nitrospira sp.]